jgi:hypothetical protein
MGSFCVYTRSTDIEVRHLPKTNFFTVVNGRMGMDPREAKQGDLIVFLPWFGKPFSFPFVIGNLGDGLSV